MIPTDRIKEAFAGKLLALLKERGMRQADLARALFITRAGVCEYVNGRKLPQMDKMIQIADILNVSMGELCCTAELRGASASREQPDRVGINRSKRNIPRKNAESQRKSA